MKIEFSPEQERIINNAARDINSGKREVIIAGLAGTGKTTCVNAILEKINRPYLVLTPTGKAANVLRKKGTAAVTIHSAIYNYKGKRISELTGKEYMAWKIKNEIRRDPSVVVIDEASMVDTKMYNDILGFGVQVLWIGDYGQLPPVGADPKIMAREDRYTLTQIFRQGENSGIITFAHDIRADDVGNNEYEHVSFVNDRIEELPLLEYDQIICSFNEQRRRINQICRGMLGRTNMFEVGDKLICLRNNKKLDIYNGELCWIEKLHKESSDFRQKAEIKTESGETINCWLNKASILGVDPPDSLSDIEILCDYGYAITCHKSQGSEWDNILVVYRESNNWDNSRWLYTAVTRAKKALTLHL